MTGGSGTPYAAGLWHISVRFPPSYPAQPPAVRFETPVLHPNINAHGRACIDTLGSAWVDDGGVRSACPRVALAPARSDAEPPHKSVPDVMRSIASLFASPERSNPARQRATVRVRVYPPPSSTAAF